MIADDLIQVLHYERVGQEPVTTTLRDVANGAFMTGSINHLIERFFDTHAGPVGEVMQIDVSTNGAAFHAKCSARRQSDGTFVLEFLDGSKVVAPSPLLEPVPRPADHGLALLEPITIVERDGVEAILTLLWRAVDNNALTAGQAAQIQAMAQMIEVARGASVPEESKRWELLGAVKSGLRYLFKEVPKDALAWWKLVEILHGIDWHHLADEIGKQL